ncbi:MAG: hypothetical protein R3360_02130 [Alphaproteobacteria bacterium]|nr:hypothetical protein [Alphaproteobacteria bacterium]
MEKSIRIKHHTSLGMFWFMGWLFSLGFLDLGFWKGLLALVVWPYFLGLHFADQPPAPAETAAIERQITDAV